MRMSGKKLSRIPKMLPKPPALLTAVSGNPGTVTSMLCVLWAVQGCSSAGAPSPAASPGPARAIDVIELTTEDIQAAYATGEYTAVQLTQAFLDRIEVHEDHYNALISMNPDAARQRRRALVRARSPLGIPSRGRGTAPR